MKDPLKILGFDHLEFAVGDLEEAAQPFLRLGFERWAERDLRERQLKSVLLVQNQISIVLSATSLSGDPVKRFFDAHGPSLYKVALLCDDALTAFQHAVNRGARILDSPRALAKHFGTVEYATVRFLTDLSLTFMSRQGNLFHEGFNVPSRSLNRGVGLHHIEHLGLNVEPEEWDSANLFLETILGWQNIPTHDWYGAPAHSSTWERSGPPSSSQIKITVNRPNGTHPKIEEALKIHHGSHWQHAAFATPDIIDTMKSLKKEAVPFLVTPPSYYESLAERPGQLKENVSELEVLGIQVDQSPSTYLLQSYTLPFLGAFFGEVVERREGNSLGANNFQGWLEASERQPQRSGVIHAEPS